MTRLREIRIKNWVIKAFIGIYPHEKNKKQKVRLNISLFQEDTGQKETTRIAEVVDYEKHYRAIKALIEKEHVGLIETLAERIAAACLCDAQVKEVRVEIEKLGLFSHVESCGVTITRSNKT